MMFVKQLPEKMLQYLPEVAAPHLWPPILVNQDYYKNSSQKIHTMTLINSAVSWLQVSVNISGPRSHQNA
jgi:hypothetical protein